jgi:hypothetical protein
MIEITTVSGLAFTNRFSTGALPNVTPSSVKGGVNRRRCDNVATTHNRAAQHDPHPRGSSRYE